MIPGRWRRCHLTITRRAEYFSGELETFLLMARAMKQDDHSNQVRCGRDEHGRFMPSSYKEYRVLNGVGTVAIGSVILHRQCGGALQGAWLGEKGDAVCGAGDGQAPGLANGFKTKYSYLSLRRD